MLRDEIDVSPERKRHWVQDEPILRWIVPKDCNEVVLVLGYECKEPCLNEAQKENNKKVGIIPPLFYMMPHYPGGSGGGGGFSEAVFTACALAFEGLFPFFLPGFGFLLVLI